MTNLSLRPLLSVVAIWTLAACMSTVKQDANSGPDAKAGGAKRIRLNEDGEGTGKGIVTYPGGDRVDWKVFDVPKSGDLEVTLKWKPPRPGLDLSMNVLDDTFHVVKRVAPSPGTDKVRKTAQ